MNVHDIVLSIYITYRTLNGVFLYLKRPEITSYDQNIRMINTCAVAYLNILATYI